MVVVTVVFLCLPSQTPSPGLHQPLQRPTGSKLGFSLEQRYGELLALCASLRGALSAKAKQYLRDTSLLRAVPQPGVGVMAVPSSRYWVRPSSAMVLIRVQIASARAGWGGPSPSKPAFLSQIHTRKLEAHHITFYSMKSKSPSGDSQKKHGVSFILFYSFLFYLILFQQSE